MILNIEKEIILYLICKLSLIAVSVSIRKAVESSGQIIFSSSLYLMDALRQPSSGVCQVDRSHAVQRSLLVLFVPTLRERNLK